MSIDSEYDPESHIELHFYEMISRLTDFKEVVTRFVLKSRSICGVEIAAKFETVFAKVGITKASMKAADALIYRNPTLRYLLQTFIIKFDVPPFVEKRLAKHIPTVKHSDIKRKKDIAPYDVPTQKKTEPAMSELISRKAMADQQELEDMKKFIEMQLDHAEYKHAYNELMIEAVHNSKAKLDHHADLRERIKKKEEVLQDHPGRKGKLPNLFKTVKIHRADMGPDASEMMAELDKNCYLSRAAMVKEREYQKEFRNRYVRELQEQQWA